MFGSKSDKSPNTKEASKGKPGAVTGEAGLSTIATGMVVHGNIESVGDVKIEGRLVGNLVCKARVVLGKKGLIEGSMDATNATIGGEISGTVICRELLQLQDTARLAGDIVTVRMSVQDGAVFTGQIEMGREAKEKLQRMPLGSLMKRSTESLSNGVSKEEKTLGGEVG